MYVVAVLLWGSRGRQGGVRPASLPRKENSELLADSLCLFSESHLDGGTAAASCEHTISHCQTGVHLHSELWILRTAWLVLQCNK